MAAVPTEEFADGEEERDCDEDEGGVAAGGGATSVGWFGFGWVERVLAMGETLCRSTEYHVGRGVRQAPGRAIE